MFLTPKLSGYSVLNVADLTEVEFVSRDMARKGLQFFREHMPGFERAWILDTASQVGTRHARRLIGKDRVTVEHWRVDGSAPDSIGLCPGPTPSFPTLEIPFGSLIPDELDGLLAAGRNLSADSRSHAPLREIPECWVMGEAAGLAAAIAIDRGLDVGDIDVEALRSHLVDRGAIVDRRPGRSRPSDQDGNIEESIHWTAIEATQAADRS